MATASVPASENGRWASSLCADCCACKDDGACCLSCVFPYQFMADNTDKAFPNAKNQSIAAGLCYSLTFYAQFISYGAASGNACVSALGMLHCASVCFHGLLRGRIRNKYAIPHPCGFCDDWCTAIWCYSCAMSQEHMQLKHTKAQQQATAQPMQANSMMAMRLPAEMKAA